MKTRITGVIFVDF